MEEHGTMMKYGSTNLVEDLERALMTYPTKEEVECTLVHQFSNGVYIREITMPAGALILGHEHTTTHFNMISKGRCTLVDTVTGEYTDIVAPCTFESKAGVRKLLYIIEETVWSTIHVTDLTDVAEIEKIVIKESNTYKEIQNVIHSYGSIRSSINRDYNAGTRGTS